MGIIWSPTVPWWEDKRIASLHAGESGRLSGYCASCGCYAKFRPNRLQCSWRFDRWTHGRLVGDFAHGGTRMVMKRHMAKALVQNFPGLSVRTVVWLGRRLPGDDELVELVVSEDLNVTAHPRASIKADPTCPACGHTFKSLLGTEDWRFKRVKGERIRVKVPRKPGAGLLVRKKDVAGFGFFRWEDRGYFCTDAVKQLAEAEGWTHVVFKEQGETIPR